MRKGGPTFFLLHLVMLALACQMSHGQEVNRSEKLNQVRALVVRSNEPYMPAPDKRAEWERLQQDNDRARIEMVKTMPGITEYLFALLEENYHASPNECLESIFEAIALRDDLQTAEIKGIAAEAQKILSRPYVRMDVGSAYLKGVVTVLGKYPSAEHEKILIAALGRGDEEYPLYVRAASGLEKIGGIEALAALDRAILKTAHFKGTHGESFHACLVISKKVIQDRLKGRQ